jgi:hypothetical protein
LQGDTALTAHEPIQPEIEDPMNALAKTIDIFLNGKHTPPKERKWGFALLVYPFGEGPHRDRMNYIGNGERADVLVAVKELAARWEGRLQEMGTRQ